MYEIHVKGTLTSKRAAHVPVIRRWKLVWERREFGTQIDKIDQRFPLKFDAWESIPEGGVAVPLIAGFSLLVKRVLSSNQVDGLKVGVSVIYAGALFSDTHQITVLPKGKERKLLSWKTDIWKGVKVDIDATLVAR